MYICLFKDLQVPVLVRHPTTQELVTNFDPYIFEVIKESEYMLKRDLDIPLAAKVLVHSSDTLRTHQAQMQVWYFISTFFNKCTQNGCS